MQYSCGVQFFQNAIAEKFTISPAIAISILNFLLLPEEDDLHNVFRYGNIKSGRELTDIKELHFVELPKFAKDRPRQLMTRFEKWLYVLKFGELYKDDPDKLPATLKAEEEIVMAVERMREAEGDAVVKELMEARQKALHDEATWRWEFMQEAEEKIKARVEKGIEKGIEKGVMKSAQKMLDAGMSREEVARILDIPIDSL
ncbi:MAG: Rpn family recombination-promoting nuclease/putative transposase [Vulcanimicrobiota bacterium]